MLLIRQEPEILTTISTLEPKRGGQSLPRWPRPVYRQEKRRCRDAAYDWALGAGHGHEHVSRNPKTCDKTHLLPYHLQKRPEFRVALLTCCHWPTGSDNERNQSEETSHAR